MDGVLESVECDGLVVSVFSVGDYPPSSIVHHPPHTLVLIGPGNPGLPMLYADFARGIHSHTHFPVWVHGFAGLESEEPLQGREEQFGLEGQVKMKKVLLKKYLTGVRVICVDHSTSGYIALQLLQDPACNQIIAEVYLLMAVFSKPDSRTGAMVNFMVHSYIFEAASALYFALFSKLSIGLQNFLMAATYRPFSYRNIPQMQAYIKPSVLNKCFLLARDLFAQKLDLELFSKYWDRLHVYCSDQDCLHSSWLPTVHNQLPSLDVRFSTTGITHIFYIDDAQLLAKEMGGWISDTIQKRNSESTKEFLHSAKVL